MPQLTDQQIWERVRAFAADCKAKNTPVHTLKNGVRNVITDVSDERVHRHSDDGKQDQQQSSVSKRDVIALWHHLLGETPDPQVRGDRPVSVCFLGLERGKSGVARFTMISKPLALK